jgi:hypothetical protein
MRATIIRSARFICGRFRGGGKERASSLLLHRKARWFCMGAAIGLSVLATACQTKDDPAKARQGAAVRTAVAYPLKASANGRYLVDQNNLPFLIVGDSPQSLIGNLSEADAAIYFADRQLRGFNALWIDLLCNTYAGCRNDGTTMDGIAPFTIPGDLSTPNAAYFQRADEMLRLAGKYGLAVFLDPVETGGWLSALRTNGPKKAYNYGQFLGNRYKNFSNIVWLNGNDFTTWATSTTDNDLVYQVMAGIASADPNHLQTVELTWYSNEDAALRPFLALDAAYSYYETYDEVLAAYNSLPTLPTFLVEANYEYDNITHLFRGKTGTLILRQQEYWAMTSGACGHFYGNDHIWPFKASKHMWTFAKNWRSYLDSPGTRELGYFNKLFHSLPWWQLVPDQSHQVVTKGYGTYNGKNGNLPAADYVTTAWIPDGSLAVIYDPAGNALQIDLAKFKAAVTAAWYDPSNGTFTTISGSPIANSGLRQFKPSDANHGGDHDWVLVLEAGPTYR